MEESGDPKKSHAQPDGKHPYQTPRLTVYGDLRMHTLTKSSGTTNDGGSHPNNMT